MEQGKKEDSHRMGGWTGGTGCIGRWTDDEVKYSYYNIKYITYIITRNMFHKRWQSVESDHVILQKSMPY